jgi:hypothetical protein
MAFADPQSVTILAAPQSLPRVSVGENRATYRKDDNTVEMTVSHTYGKRNRRALRLTTNKVAADPLVPATNVAHSISVTLVVDVPIVGYTVAEQKALVDALTAYLTVSSGANATKFLGGES